MSIFLALIASAAVVALAIAAELVRQQHAATGQHRAVQSAEKGTLNRPMLDLTSLGGSDRPVGNAQPPVPKRAVVTGSSS